MIDFLNADSNFLKSVIARSIEIQYEGVSIPAVSIEDLIILKLFSFHRQDQIDIENLIISGTPISWKYLKSNIETFQLD
jgi:predicted nucleotidyltransferase